MDYFEDRSFLFRRRDYEEITSYHLSASSDGKEVDGLLGETEEYTDKRPETSWHRKY